MRSDVMDEVATILRQAAAEAILPRYRKLLAGDVEEKTPGEVVTVADREAEQIISPKLAALLPGSRVVGEEAVASNPSLMDGLDEGHVWLVDPLDGTPNFVAGSAAFSVMVALLQDGRTMASWLLDPMSGQLSVASRGDGAFIDGVRVHTSTASLTVSECRGSVLTRFLPEEIKEQVAVGSPGLAEVLPGAKCAGVDYPSIIRGSQNFLMFWRLLPWDHARGAFLVEEAGGHVARLDGSEYWPSDQRPGLLIGQNREVWDVVRSTLLNGQGE
ncbi:inositol monophosphatase family protein [Microvirga lotononidis]|uniref:Inositol monophosphatase/fructose-1,6-bisphosphatase family protein n=1 Tax=Microvirga lotononidis TaxID=864069 RepID=I4Z4K0_9HYPH|nr:inositol monophosphatase family protein [Microvirga lotononidis]EIM31142.1 inositol monophosphatase/fructose-1,6-bisphosphatase family protein [Microvirga lotononidis]WQO30466.1 inositol monophosphatase family protein [Microvirga lotononidis]